jgi:hypothetical protein
MVVGRTITLASIGIEVTTGGTAGAVVRLGIYNVATDGNLPGALLADYGTVVATGTGFQEKIIPGNQVLAPGIYFLAAATQGAAATRPILRGTASPSMDYQQTQVASTQSSQNNQVGEFMGSVTGALTADLTGLTASTTPACSIVIKGA